jgi:HAD superfamily hydrolase (TIGR01509 family)
MQSASCPTSAASPTPRWEEVDTVLLDMDGTLLDLHFDNFFWLELVPRRYAQQHELTLQAARTLLAPRFAAKQGTLDWYCTDFWSRELSLDIARLKHDMREHVRFLPGAQEFLQTLADRRMRTVLVTNAHHDSLSIKSSTVDLQRYFDSMISSHRFGAPKEHDEYWVKLAAELRYDPARTLFVDDSLAVLRAARRHGIAQIFAILRPDSTQAVRETTEFPAVEAVIDLLDGEPLCGASHARKASLHD